MELQIARNMRGQKGSQPEQQSYRGCCDSIMVPAQSRLQVDELTSLLHAEYSLGEVELKTKSLNKNFERLVVSRQKIRGYYAAIESGKFLSERLKIEENITTEITELKKASEVLKKAIERRFGEIAKLRAKKQQETSMIVDSDLSLPEVEEIVSKSRRRTA